MRTNRVGILVGMLSVFPLGALQAAEPCTPWAAKVVSMEGRVEASLIGEPRWMPARLEQTFCPGDRVRIESRSRAAVLLSNQTVLRLDEGTTLTFTQVQPAEPSWLELLKGAIHFLSRTPAQLKINTPFISAAVEGTEFVLRVTEHETALWVFEGRVRFANPRGSLLIAGGEAAAAQAGRAPQRRVVVRPREAVQWALYYPPLVDYRLSSYPAGPDARGIREALELYRRDDLSNAFARLDKVPDPARGASYYGLRAGLLLNVGRVQEARADLDRALTLEPKNATALSLQSVIRTVQNEQEKALYLAHKAEELDPTSPIPKVALSYVHQAKFDLESALKNIEQAIALAPTDPLVYARLAELQLSRGDLERALEATKTAVALNPDLAQTQAVLGFAYLTEIDIDRAKASFEKAIALDPAAPLARLGLGLAKIRDGELKEGTQEIEIAASLDPNNSLVRSYLGKAYFEEKRGGLATSEFETAKQLDPKDPTPWFYDAIHKHTTNRPVEALHDLQQAIERNDNRAVYRSKLLLDEDLAARGASLGRIYNELAFEQLGRVQAWNALSADPTSYSGHRLLSDTYAGLPRHDVARVSELLQSQLLQPINITPVQPQLAESDLFLLGGLGPSALSLNEFNPLFERERLSLLASGLAASNDTYSDEVVHSGLWKRLSYSIGQFHYQTAGFRPNSDLDTNIYNAFAQYALAPHSNVQVELRHQRTENGDLRELLNPKFIFENQRIEFERDSARLGFGFELPAKGMFLGSLAYREINREEMLPVFESFSDIFEGAPGISSLLLPLLPAGFNREQSATNDAENSSFELQYLRPSGRFNLILGGGYTYQEKIKTALSTGRLSAAIPLGLAEQIRRQLAVQDPSLALKELSAVLGDPVSAEELPDILSSSIDGFVQDRMATFFGQELIDTSEGSAYLYTGTEVLPDLDLTLALAFLHLDRDTARGSGLHLRRQHLLPKVGLIWHTLKGTTLRAAWFRSVKRSFASGQTIEPTHIAGFNQLFDDPDATCSQRYGFAIDQLLSPRVRGGFEVSWRDLKVPDFATGELTNTIAYTEHDEESHRAYLYWTPTDQLALKTEYFFERFDRDPRTFLFAGVPLELTTHRAPIALRYYSPNGIFSSLTASYINQSGLVRGFGDQDTDTPASDNFWVLDFSLGYRLPKRYGLVTFGIRNFLDQGFSFQEPNFETLGETGGEIVPPTFVPERVFFGQVTLAF